MIPLNATVKELEILAEKEKPSICRQVARHPNASPELLKKLFNRYYYDVLANPVLELILLENPDFLSELDDVDSSLNCFETEELPLFCYKIAVKYRDIWIRQAIALNPNTPAYTLQKLSTDKNIEVRAAVALNKNTSVEEMEKMILAEESKLIDLIEAILDINEYYFEYYQDLPLFFYDLAVRYCNDSRYTDFCEAIAHNNYTPPHILNTLSLSNNIEVRAEVASNSNTPIDILNKLVLDENVEVLTALACNKNISKKIIEQLAQKQIYDINLNLAGNLKTPRKLLSLLAKGKCNFIRAAVARNINTPIEVLNFLADNKNERIINNLAKNPNSTSKTLEKILPNGNRFDRFYICVHKNVSDKIIEKLLLDGDEWVAECAKRIQAKLFN